MNVDQRVQSAPGVSGGVPYGMLDPRIKVGKQRNGVGHRAARDSRRTDRVDVISEPIWRGSPGYKDEPNATGFTGVIRNIERWTAAGRPHDAADPVNRRRRSTSATCMSLAPTTRPEQEH